MKKKYLTLLALLPCLAFTACAGPVGPGFENPGDQLGGGGTGEVAGEVDDTTNGTTKDDMQDKSDLGDLSENTSGEGATAQAPTSGIVKISKSGSYYFKGEYGGISIAKKELDLHFIFDGATFTNNSGVAIDGTEYKKTSLVITLNEGTTNTVVNGGDDVNAIHIKGSLSFNGKGTLNVVSNSKSAIKASKELRIVDANINLSAINHGISAAAVAAANCTIDVTGAGKDGINAEGDEMTAFSTKDGYVSLTNVNYACNVEGDGIQAATVVYIDGGHYEIKTNGNFVQKSAANMEAYGMESGDFMFVKQNNDFQRVGTDEVGRYSSSNLYGLSQSCKGIKVGEIEYEDDDENTVVVTEGDYLIAIAGGHFDIDSTDDAIRTNSGNVLIEGGTFKIATYDDAITSDNLTKITDGDITIRKSYEGIEGAYVEISGGEIELTADDDGINAASGDRSVTPHIIISGGDVKVNSSGDGIDSNGSILISGGTVLVYGPTTGADAGLDADKGIVITGGYVFVTSTLGMVETPSTNSTQCVVSYAHQSKITAGSVISLTDEEGSTLLSVEILKDCQSIIFSTPDLQMESTYSVYGGETKLTNFTISSILTVIGSAGNSFPGGGKGPGGTPPGGFGGRR